MSPTPEQQIANKLMLAFEGPQAPQYILDWLRQRGAAGFTLFRELNYESPAQIRELTAALQAAAAATAAEKTGIGLAGEQAGLLIAADQEGGQLIAMGAESSQFPGNMALGAAGDFDLTRRVAEATGRELAALGVNVNYAPVCDLNTNPSNPSLGIRSFSDNPELAAGMAAATVAGLESQGVAATLKHFPGKGEAAVDSHYQLPLIEHSRARLEKVELLPFKAGIELGASLIMTGHFAIPSLTGRHDLPATLARAVMTDLVRADLGYQGVIITDALDMGAITQGAGQIIDVIAALRAGVDLLLLTANREVQERLYAGLQLALSRGLFEFKHLGESHSRITRLQQRLNNQPQPGLEVIGSAAHRQLAQEAARRSITLLRNQAKLLPLRLGQDERILVVHPRPKDLTPADTSSYVQPSLAESLRAYHAGVDEIVCSHTPPAEEIAAIREQAGSYDLLVIGTINASMNPQQAALANTLLESGVPAVTAALRTPYDLSVYPQSLTHLCTYSILQPSMQALAAGLFGQVRFEGRLPVQVRGLFEPGAGLTI